MPEYFVYDGDTLGRTGRSASWPPMKMVRPPSARTPAIDLGQVVLQLDRNAAPTHRYLWGQAVDQILADETVADGSSEDVKWLLTDHQNTVRDMVALSGDTPAQWQVANHVTYESFGKVASETAPTVDTLFTSFGRDVDPGTELRYHGNRWCTVGTTPRG